MRKLIWPVLFLFLLLVQGAASVFYTGWLSFDVPLLALYSFAMLLGETRGAAAGIFIGFLQDAMTTGIFGFHILTRALIGYTVGLTKEKIFKDNMKYHMASIAVCCLLIRFFFLCVELIRNGGYWKIIPMFLWDTIGYCLGNMLLIVPCVMLVKRIYDWIREEDISY